MTKRFTAFAAVALLLLATACKKENDSPTLNHVGYWRGHIDVISGSLLLKPGGEAALYVFVYGNDTAGATKGYGRYTISNGLINAYGVTSGNDTLFYQTRQQSTNVMSGIFFTSYVNQAPPCELWRQ